MYIEMPRKSATATAPAATVAAPIAAPVTEVNQQQQQAQNHDDAALKNINYKNMLLTGNYNMLKPDIITNPNIDDILENEKNASKSDPWNKLDKSAKIGKLKEFAGRHGKTENHTEQEITALYQFLVSALEQKKLMRAKDVIYDKTTGEITSIPCLIYHAGFKKFTLKRCEKRQSTLKSLAPTTSMSKKRKLGMSSDDTSAPAAPAPVPSSATTEIDS
jgi:DNA primase